MTNWTLDDIQVGMFVIPNAFNVYGSPHQALLMAEQISMPESEFGLHNFQSGILSAKFATTSDLLEHLNENDMRLLTRKELAFLILYMDKDLFALPPEDQPIDNG